MEENETQPTNPLPTEASPTEVPPTEVAQTKPSQTEMSPAEQAASAEPVPAERPLGESDGAQPDPAATLAAMDHAEAPAEIILTVRMRKLFFFPVKDAEIKVMQGDHVVETGHTDSNGQALFKLAPGEYTIAAGDKSTGIALSKNATIKL